MAAEFHEGELPDTPNADLWAQAISRLELLVKRLKEQGETKLASEIGSAFNQLHSILDKHFVG